MKKNVLLLGARGFIGSAILKQLLAEGQYRIAALEHRQAVDAHPDLFVIKSSLETLRISKLPFQPDFIIHAARNRTGKWGAAGRYLMGLKGRYGNARLVAQLKRSKIPARVVYVSGSLMYGSKSSLIEEDCPLHPASFARQYVHAELPFLRELNNNKLEIAMVRAPWVIGRGSWFYWMYRNFMERHNAVPLYGPGNNMMTFIDVDDLAKAVIHVMDSGFTGLLNVYHPQYLSQRDWAATISRITGLPIKHVTPAEISLLGKAVGEAFETNICLSSRHKEISAHLHSQQFPIEETVKKYL